MLPLQIAIYALFTEYIILSVSIYQHSCEKPSKSSGVPINLVMMMHLPIACKGITSEKRRKVLLYFPLLKLEF